MNCPNCSYELFDGFLFCYECGLKITNENVDVNLKSRNASNWSKSECSKCGSVLYNNAKFCHNCGFDVKLVFDKKIDIIPISYPDKKDDDLDRRAQETANRVNQEIKEENKGHAKTFFIGVGLLILSWVCAKAGEAIQMTGTDTLLGMAFGIAWVISGLAGIVITFFGIIDWWY